jgi:lon-related putative ATP-dependent protease
MSARKLLLNDVVVRINTEEIKRLETDDLETGIIGQPRAINALNLGTQIKAKGYNIFVTGLPGTGRKTAIKKILNGIKPEPGALHDIAYVYNFRQPDKPKHLKFKPGEAKKFKQDIHQLIENLKKSIKVRIESKSFHKRKNRLIQEIQKQENKLLSQFEEKLTVANFQLTQIGEGANQTTEIIPVYEGKAVDFDELHLMVENGQIKEEIWDSYMEKYCVFMDEMSNIIKKMKLMRMELEKQLNKIRKEHISPVIQAEIDLVRHNYDMKNVGKYLNELENDIKDHIYLFTSHTDARDHSGNRALIRYGVNVIVEYNNTQHVPVVMENAPSLCNLFGIIESRVDPVGGVKTSFMRIKSGSLLQASGGYLILQAEDILRDSTLWQRFKNALMLGQIEIPMAENPLIQANLIIKPEPIKINTKIIIIGDPNLYEVLYCLDEDFHKLFKVTAEFDSQIELTPENMKQYIKFIKTIVKKERLKNFTYNGIAAVLEYGIRISNHKRKLTTRFSQLVDIICEAGYWAEKQNSPEINAEAVKRAIKERNYLANLPESKIQEMITDGEVLINVEGRAVGKINALTLYDRGYYTFGRPARITSQISPGDSGVINIEREVGLSGDIHDKGVFILEGLIRSRYAKDFPLSITASICFEQSYSCIDGDSASTAEVCALLSAISGVPLRQDLAVTGSVNQMGEIQPIGGVTEKVEGFYYICKKLKLTKTQGVVIPLKNIHHLIISDEVAEAVHKGIFHIYAVEDIDEVFELFTGKPVGVRDSTGLYPEDTLNWLVEKKLREMALKIKEYGYGKV